MTQDLNIKFPGKFSSQLKLVILKKVGQNEKQKNRPTAALT